VYVPVAFNGVLQAGVAPRACDTGPATPAVSPAGSSEPQRYVTPIRVGGNTQTGVRVPGGLRTRARQRLDGAANRTERIERKDRH
jgi:hypothetical protein